MNGTEWRKSGEFQYAVGPMLRLKGKFSRRAAAHLVETPLSKDQVIENVDADDVLVTDSVRDTAQLDWRLLGFASSVRVLEPPALGARLAAATRATVAVQQET